MKIDQSAFYFSLSLPIISTNYRFDFVKELLIKFLLIALFALPSLLMAQDTTVMPIDTVDNKYKRLYNSEDPLFKPQKEEPKEFKKKKDFWGFLLGKKIAGLRTRRAYTSKGQGRNATVESFRILKKWESGSSYVYYKYYYDSYSQRVVKKHKIKPEDTLTLKVLHGPYKKIKGDDTLLLGYFYKGMKHGRWISQNKERERHFADTAISFQTLKDKTYWYKGWPKDAELIYFESDRSKLKEVIPYMNGEKTGKYYKFFKSGHIEAKGEYKYGYKIKGWTEYYEGKRGTSKKTEWEFPKDAFYEDQKNEDQFITAKWNELGEMTFPEDHTGEKAKRMKKRRGRR